MEMTRCTLSKLTVFTAFPSLSFPVVVIVELAGNKNVVFGSADLPGYVLGTITAAVSGYFAIKFMLRLIKNKSYKGFSIYCIIAGVAGIILSFIK